MLHTSTSSYTEVLQAIQERTDRLADDVETIKIQNDLARLDREWTEEHKRRLVRGPRGGYFVPTHGAGVLTIIISVVMSALWMAGASAGGAPGSFTLLGLAVMAIGVVIGFVIIFQATAYQERFHLHQRRRQEILRALQRPRGERRPEGSDQAA